MQRFRTATAFRGVNGPAEGLTGCCLVATRSPPWAGRRPHTWHRGLCTGWAWTLGQVTLRHAAGGATVCPQARSALCSGPSPQQLLAERPPCAGHWACGGQQSAPAPGLTELMFWRRIGPQRGKPSPWPVPDEMSPCCPGPRSRPSGPPWSVCQRLSPRHSPDS